MLFARITSLLVTLLAFGLVASSKPLTGLSRRDSTVSCLSAIGTVNSTVAGARARFGNITEDTPANRAFADSLMGEIAQAIVLTNFISNAIPPDPDTDENPIVDALGEVMDGIATVLGAIQALMPDFKSEGAAEVDSELSQLVNIIQLLISDFDSMMEVFASQLVNLFTVMGLTQLQNILNN